MSALLFVMAAAGVQAPTRPRDATQGVQTLRAYARCVVSREPDSVRALLAMDFRTDAYGRSMRELALKERSCLRGAELRFGGVLLAGNFAEALLPEVLGGRTIEAAVAATPARPEPRNEDEEVSLCVVGTAPAAVEAMLVSDLSSDAERQALQALIAPLQACVTRESEARVNAHGLRARLALASYRTVTQGATSVPGNAN